jgi:hypothetical protein
MNGATWLDDLSSLLARFSGMGIGADIAAMSLCELSGLYSFLRRIAES